MVSANGRRADEPRLWSRVRPGLNEQATSDAKRAGTSRRGA
jgi:hypothetical protein